jgi:hypothetical protein
MFLSTPIPTSSHQFATEGFATTLTAYQALRMLPEGMMETMAMFFRRRDLVANPLRRVGKERADAAAELIKDSRQDKSAPAAMRVA